MKAWIAGCLLMLLPALARAEPLRLLTEEYPPYNFSGPEGPSGIAVEQVRLMMERAGIDYGIEIMPWARAFADAGRDAGTCVFTTRHDAERHARFKWVEPLLVDRMIMIRRAGTAIAPETLEAAKAFTIGTQRDDTSASFLEENGFPHLDYAASMTLTLKKLVAGRIDLMMTSLKTYEKLHAEGHAIEPALALESGRYGLACNLAIADDVIAGMQSALDGLIADGTQARIYARYGLRAGD
ncbi:substrate-binding periplasmic protein [Ensifer soli]|uniref:substrate-binding periplasmic protein n=1 Tax=Ciceribacter sp. sgz301302 TaxID=3342379 RepID=UPI0035B6EAF2